MPSGREARHTLLPLGTKLDQRILYASDLAEGSGAPTYTSVGLSPCWDLATGETDDILGDLKIPTDRVPNTPIKAYIVFCGDANGGAHSTVVLNLEYLAVGEGSLLTANPQQVGKVVVVPAQNCQKTTTEYLIPESAIDGRRETTDIQFKIEREGDDLANIDDYAGNLEILKIIFEYTKYVNA